MHQFKAGDLVVADRGFSAYTLLALLLQRVVQGLFRLHQARPPDLRKGKRLDKHDRLFFWTKPFQPPRYLSQSLWNAIPDQIQVRALRFSLHVPGCRVQSVTLVTTLLNPEEYPAEELACLYAHRWRVELWFRNVKTSMGMEVLRCKTPKMVHKELGMLYIAYNLIRCLMAQASVPHDAHIGSLSFKGTVDALRQFAGAIARARSRKSHKQLFERSLEVIAGIGYPNVPDATNPRRQTAPQALSAAQPPPQALQGHSSPQSLLE